MALATTVSRSRERLKKLPWVPPETLFVTHPLNLFTFPACLKQTSHLVICSRLPIIPSIPLLLRLFQPQNFTHGKTLIFLTSKRWRRSWMLMCKVTHISPSGYLERFNAGEQGDLLQDCVMPPCPSQSDSQEVKPCRVCTQAEPHPTIRQTNHVCTAMEERFEDSLLCEPEAGRCCCRAGTAVVLGTGPHFDSAENRRE